MSGTKSKTPPSPALTSLPASLVAEVERSELSGQDENSRYEMFVVNHIATPLMERFFPMWLKPNLLTLCNSVTVWSQLALALLVVVLDNPDPAVSPDERRAGLWLRLAVAVLVYVSMLLDMLDGMQARRSKQSSKLGEILDHALDAANIPLISSGFCLANALDKYSVAIAMVACSAVFNSQLTVYRHRRMMIPPPSNGPESQTLVVVLQCVCAVLFWQYGRAHWAMEYVALAISVVGNVIQLINTRYFIGFLARDTLADFVRFMIQSAPPALLFLTGRISTLTFCVFSVSLGFRLNGAYVLFTVVNMARAQRGASRIESRFTSLSTGWDYVVVFWMCAFFLAAAAGLTSTAPGPTPWSMPALEWVLMFCSVTHLHTNLLRDLYDTLPDLLPSRPRDAPLITLIW